MNILYFTKYSRKGASSRLRSYQYFPFLEKEGVKVVVKPLFDDVYIENLYQGEKSKKNIIIAYLNRFLVLFNLKKFDRIIIEKELFPYLPSFFERLLFFLGKHYIVDYDDAIFHNYDLNTNRLIRFFLKNKIDNVMKYSQCVIAGNSYLANRAIKSGAKKVEIIPTVIDMDRYEVLNKGSNKNTIIGWIGSPSTLKYIKSIKPALQIIIEKYNLNVHIIGAKENLSLGDNIKYIEWTETSEVSEIQKFDIGIMPLENTPWELGKCSYKLIQYMGCGIPVIASPVGMNVEVVKDGWNGFLANDIEEWCSSIENLIKDKSLKRKLGGNGRNLVLNKFTVNKVFLQYKELIFKS